MQGDASFSGGSRSCARLVDFLRSVCVDSATQGDFDHVVKGKAVDSDEVIRVWDSQKGGRTVLRRVSCDEPLAVLGDKGNMMLSWGWTMDEVKDRSSQKERTSERRHRAFSLRWNVLCSKSSSGPRHGSGAVQATKGRLVAQGGGGSHPDVNYRLYN